MNTHDDNELATAGSAIPLDPQRVLESVVSELEYLVQETPPWSGSDLIQLHGALLAYNLEGRADLLPNTSFGLSARRWRERRVVRTARQIVERGAGDATATMGIAADLIVRHLHLIDPELQERVA
jgi:hypothetical protein